MPAIEVDFVASAIGSTQVRLDWIDVPEVSSYVVRRGTTPALGASTVVATLPRYTGVYNDYGRTPNTTYYYWLRDQ